MEPPRITAPHLLPILEQLQAREPIFHRLAPGTTRADLERMTDAGFWETGASGQRYSRDFVIDTVLARQAAPAPETWTADDFHCAEVAADLYLLTYTLIQEARRTTRRGTLWRRAEEGWQIVYHQGTLVAAG
jgi:hypothetical protein